MSHGRVVWRTFVLFLFSFFSIPSFVSASNGLRSGPAKIFEITQTDVNSGFLNPLHAEVSKGIYGDDLLWVYQEDVDLLTIWDRLGNNHIRYTPGCPVNKILFGDADNDGQEDVIFLCRLFGEIVYRNKNEILNSVPGYSQVYARSLSGASGFGENAVFLTGAHAGLNGLVVLERNGPTSAFYSFTKVGTAPVTTHASILNLDPSIGRSMVALNPDGQGWNGGQVFVTAWGSTAGSTLFMYSFLLGGVNSQVFSGDIVAIETGPNTTHSWARDIYFVAHKSDGTGYKMLVSGETFSKHFPTDLGYNIGSSRSAKIKFGAFGLKSSGSHLPLAYPGTNSPQVMWVCEQNRSRAGSGASVTPHEMYWEMTPTGYDLAAIASYNPSIGEPYVADDCTALSMFQDINGELRLVKGDSNRIGLYNIGGTSIGLADSSTGRIPSETTTNLEGVFGKVQVEVDRDAGTHGEFVAYGPGITQLGSLANHLVVVFVSRDAADTRLQADPSVIPKAGKIRVYVNPSTTVQRITTTVNCSNPSNRCEVRIPNTFVTDAANFGAPRMTGAEIQLFGYITQLTPGPNGPSPQLYGVASPRLQVVTETRFP